MTHYVGIDASLETVNICIVDQDGIIVLESKIEPEPSAIVETLNRFDRPVARVGLEAVRPHRGFTVSCAPLDCRRSAWNVGM